MVTSIRHTVISLHTVPLITRFDTKLFSRLFALKYIRQTLVLVFTRRKWFHSPTLTIPRRMITIFHVGMPNHVSTTNISYFLAVKLLHHSVPLLLLEFVSSRFMFFFVPLEQANSFSSSVFRNCNKIATVRIHFCAEFQICNFSNFGSRGQRPLFGSYRI